MASVDISDDSMDSFVSELFGSMEENTDAGMNKIIERIMCLWLQFNLPIKAFDRLISIIRDVPAADSDSSMTLNVNFHQCLRKALEPNEVVLYFHCKQCDGYQAAEFGAKESALCGRCDVILQDNQFFIYIGIRHQLMNSLKVYLHEIIEFQQKVHSRHATSPDTIRDIWDGHILKEMLKKFEKDILLPLTVNTDGAAIYNSRSISIWPIQICQSFLPPEIRFKNENLLLVGLYVGQGAPNMNSYFYPFFTEITALEDEKIYMSRNGKEFSFQPILSHCVVDLQAKTKVQGIKPCNSHCACTYCLHPGESIPNLTRGCFIRYLFEELPSPLRKHIETVEVMLRVKDSKPINGIEKMSCFGRLQNFDIIFSFMYDYMHQILLGPVKLLLHAWFDKKNSNEWFYVTPKRQRIINSRLAKIKSLNYSMNPRPIGELQKFKAKDFRNYLLYYIVPCFKGELPEKCMKNFQLLSAAIYILLGDNITAESVRFAKSKLMEFVKEFESLYGKQRVTMNIHLITHIPILVQLSGPLWAQSAFFFESNNGNLVKSIKGPTHVLSQITKKYLLQQQYRKKAVKHDDINQLTLSQNINAKHNLAEIEHLRSELKLPEYTKFYKKMNIKKAVYTSAYYYRAKRTCNYVVHLSNDSIGIIKFYLEQNDKCFAYIQKCTQVNIIDHVIQIKKEEDDYFICNVQAIQFKYIYLNLGLNKEFAIRPPNLYEHF
jgi:predicted metallopeptidase